MPMIDYEKGSSFANIRAMSPYLSPDGIMKPTPVSFTFTRPKTAAATALRPKSVSNKMKSQSLSGITLPDRPYTAFLDTRPMGCTECDRLIELTSREPLRRHPLHPTLPVKKAPPKPKAMAWEGTPMCVQVGPGYSMYRSKSKITMNIDSDNFFTRDEVHEEVAKKAELDVKDLLIMQLQEQIADLQLYLEEEKLNHKETAEKCARELNNTISMFKEEHANQMKIKEEENQQILAETKEEYERQFDELKTESSEKIGMLQKDIDYLQASFEVYKSSLTQEFQTKADQKEALFRKSMEEKKDTEIEEITKKLTIEKNYEKKMMEQEHKRFIDKMKKEHKQDLVTLANRYSDIQETMDLLKYTEEQLKSANTTIETLNKEIEGLHKTNASLREEVMTTQIDLEKSKAALEEFGEQFEERIQKVEQQYRYQIECLQKQTIDLRRAYLGKCGQLVEANVKSDMELRDRMESAKETMINIIQTRVRTELSMAALNPEESEQPRHSFTRPLSAPLTKVELDWAHCTAGETQSSVKGH